MSRVRPILFNTEMVQAILDGRKTVTRRIVKPQLPNCCYNCMIAHVDFEYDKRTQNVYCTRCGEFLHNGGFPYRPSFQIGDILYVRETWFYEMHLHDKVPCELDLPSGRYSHRYVYKADDPDYPVGIGVAATGWRPSIHMPKEAARIWLKVTDVRVERLQKITSEQAYKEGVGNLFLEDIAYSEKDYGCPVDLEYGVAKEQFAWLWDSTIKKPDITRYGWEANPCVWVIEFEQCGKPEGWLA